MDVRAGACLALLELSLENTAAIVFVVVLLAHHVAVISVVFSRLC